MSNLTKRDLTIRISNETNLTQAKVLSVIELTLQHLIESLSRGQTVELRNFGAVKVTIRKARVGRNPNKPENDVPIPQRSVVKFRSGKDLGEKVRLLSKKGPSN
jgi:nucleoid DNA-binding protein